MRRLSLGIARYSRKGLYHSITFSLERMSELLASNPKHLIQENNNKTTAEEDEKQDQKRVTIQITEEIVDRRHFHEKVCEAKIIKTTTKITTTSQLSVGENIPSTIEKEEERTEEKSVVEVVKKEERVIMLKKSGGFEVQVYDALSKEQFEGKILDRTWGLLELPFS